MPDGERGDRTVWVRLRYDAAPYGLVVSYADSLGHVHRAASANAPPRGWIWQPLPEHQDAVYWPSAATADLMQAIAEAPTWRSGPFGSGPVPVAVVITPPPGTTERPSRWEAATESLLQTLGVARSKFSMAVDAGWTAHGRRLTLPLRILVAGPRPRRLVDYVRGIPGGLKLDRIEASALDAIPDDTDILLTSAAAVRRLLADPSWRAPPLIVIDGYQGDFLPAEPVPPGTSVVGLPFGRTDRGGSMVTELVAGLVHNLPLHEAIVAAGRISGIDPRVRLRIRVVTTPRGLDVLRLDPVLDRTRTNMRSIARLRGMEDMPSAVARHDVSLPAPHPDLSTVTNAVQRGSRLERDFTGEGRGLVPVLEADEARAAAQPALDYVAAVGRHISRDRRVLARLESEQERRATIWVSEDDGAFAGVEPDEVLARDTGHELNVGVGIRWDHDLVPVTAPGLDPLLPPTDEATYPVTISVFSDAAVFDGPTSQRLDLTRVGPSGPLSFHFRTPPRGSRLRIRVMLYFRRHLLQAFELNAQLGARRKPARRGRGLQVSLLFSRTERLSDIENHFPERALSVATNDNGHGRHRLMFDTGDGVPFDEVTLAQLQTSYRKQLNDVYGRQASSRLTEKLLRQFVTDMARRGRDIWDELYSAASDELQTVLRSIASSDEPVTIQHLRLKPTYAFPWPMVYDWEIADSAEVRARTPICLGGTGDESCRCRSGSTDTICVRGFWGIRHVIEEFVRSEDIDAPTDTVTHPDGAAPVACTLGVADNWSTALISRLEQRFGPNTVLRLQAGDSLFERLRDEAQRPAVLVLIGHLSNQPVINVANAPDPPHISVETVERFLSPRALVREAAKGRWVDPRRSVVLLLACGSAADDLGKFSHGFVLRLSSMGAAAVVACEEKIDTGLAADFAEWTISQLQTVGPGESLRRWRARLLAQANPCGFLFACFGNAHVKDPAFPPAVTP